MLVYIVLFLMRYFPFWAVPVAILSFEVGLYYFNRRERIQTVVCFVPPVVLVVLTVIWILREGYWRAGPWVRQLLFE